MDAIILAGGKGTRLGGDIPKAMVKLKGKPIIGYQLDYILKFKSINNIILSLGHKASEVIEFVKDNYSVKNIIFSVEDEPLGTGGAIKKAMNSAKSDYVLVFNGDDITDINIEKLGKNKENTICVAHPRLVFGLVIEKDGYAIFDEKPELDDWVSCGWYLLKRKEMLKVLPDKGSIEKEVFPNIKLRVFKHKGFWKTVNTPKDITEFEKTA